MPEEGDRAARNKTPGRNPVARHVNGAGGRPKAAEEFSNNTTSSERKADGMVGESPEAQSPRIPGESLSGQVATQSAGGMAESGGAGRENDDDDGDGGLRGALAQDVQKWGKRAEEIAAGIGRPQRPTGPGPPP